MSNQLGLFSEEEDHYKVYPLTPQEAFDRLEAGNKGFQLNAGQQAAVDFLVPFCTGKSDFQRVLLMGYAGTGKTFTINRVVEAVRRLNPGIAFGMTAPTHKAVRQLYKHSELKDDLDFGTIHSFLGLKQTLKPNPRNKSEMIEVFEPDRGLMGARKIDEINVLIIDEASMLSDELYEHIDDAVRSGRIQVIFMGDGLQIPPVGKKQDTGISDAIPFVPAQRHSRKIHLLELTEIVRQGAGNPIIEYSMAIRNQYRNQVIQSEFSHTIDSGVEVIHKEPPHGLPKLRELFKQYFCTPEFELDPDYMKVIAWRNDTVDYFNREIRLLIHQKETMPRIVDKDKLVLDKPYFIKKTMLPNNEELLVLSHEIIQVPVKYFIIDRTATSAFQEAAKDQNIEDVLGKKHYTQDLKVYKCLVKIMNGAEYYVNILHEDSEVEYKDIRDRMIASAKSKGTEFFEQKEMWKQYYDLEKKFAQTKYNYCLTAHKAQGSTYDYCISMEWDIQVNRDIEERNRIRYVAATRARNKLYIVK